MIDLIDTILDSLTGTAEALYAVFTCIPLLIAAVLYVLLGLALTSLCRASHKGSVWMAWVPFANQYLLGQMADVYTDDRVLRGEVSPAYAPSTLRRKMLGFSIVSSIFSGIAGTAMLVAFFTGFVGLFTGFLGGWFGNSEAVEGAERMLGVFAVSFLIFTVTAAIYALFHILYLVSSCKAHYRLLFMLGAPAPTLWCVTLIVTPALTTILLFAFTRRKREVLTDKFFPPMEAPEATEAPADRETPPPQEPPMPELYQL